MITVKVVVDGEVKASASCHTKYGLPDVITQTTAQWDQDPYFVWQREDRIKDASGELVEVRISYKSAVALPMVA